MRVYIRNIYKSPLHQGMSHPSKRCRLSRKARQPGPFPECDLPPGPACLADFGVKFARVSANSLLEGHEQRRQLLRMHLRKTLILDSVFTGMAAWEDTIRIYLNAAADVLEVPRPKIIHRTACDCDPTALMVLGARSQQLRHSALFASCEGRLPEAARKRMLRLLPKPGATDLEAAQAFDRVYAFLLNKQRLCFPEEATDIDIVSGQPFQVQWAPPIEESSEKFLLLRQGSTPCVAFSRRACQPARGTSHSTMSPSYVWFAEQNHLLSLPYSAVAYHENLWSFPWARFTDRMDAVAVNRRQKVCPTTCGFPARRERGLGFLAGKAMAWFGPEDHEAEFRAWAACQVECDASAFMFDSDEHIQETF